MISWPRCMSVAIRKRISARQVRAYCFFSRDPRARRPVGVTRSYVFAAAHPGQGDPAPDRGQVGGEEPFDEHGCDRLCLRMPALVSPAIRPASMTPAPPGTGTAPPTMAANVLTVIRVANGQFPTACSDAPRASMTKSWARTEPAEDVKNLARLSGDLLDVGPDVHQVRADFLAAGHPPEPGAARSGSGASPGAEQFARVHRRGRFAYPPEPSTAAIPPNRGASAQMNYERLYSYRFRDIDQDGRAAVWNEIAPTSTA